MTGLLDLPVEIRLKIFQYYPTCGGPIWSVTKCHPPASLVNRQLRDESLDAFYRHYRWSICIAISEDGNMAYLSSEIVKYLQALQEDNQLCRIQRVRFMYTFPGVTSFSPTDPDPSTHPFDAQNLDRVSFYDTLRDVLWQAPKLRLIEFPRAWFDGRHVHRMCSPACLRLVPTLPKTCKYVVTPAPFSLSYSMFADQLEEATGKPLLCERAK